MSVSTVPSPSKRQGELRDPAAVGAEAEPTAGTAATPHEPRRNGPTLSPFAESSISRSSRRRRVASRLALTTQKIAVRR
jgi:hypothetical protein